MTRLLVSVRSVAEAQLALDCGVHLIDVKEPDRGSLGAAEASTIADIAQRIGGRRPLSAALGELLSAVELPAAVTAQLQYAKFGLSGCRRHSDWLSLWEQALARLPTDVGPVAVVYADYEHADAPEPAEILRHALALGCRAVFFDTYDKARGSLLAHLDARELQRWIGAVQDDGMLCVVAGGLGPAEAEAILPLEPDLIAVRGAVCQGDRRGELDAGRVRQWAARLANRSLVEPNA